MTRRFRYGDTRAAFHEDGEIFFYRGNRLILKTEQAGENQAERVEAAGDILMVRGAPEDRKRFLLYWYTAETEKIVRELVPQWSKKLKARPKLVTVKYAKTRWGSCSSSGRIFFNSRLSMLSCDVAEYVVVHELCHLKQMNHGPVFWQEVVSALPGAMSLRRSLRAQEKTSVLSI